MRAAGEGILGLGDFRAFTDDDPEEKSTRVLMQQVAVATVGDLVLIRVVGSHFLWRMVRRLVGVLVAVGQKDLPPGDVARLLMSASDLPARLTAPSSGLFLESVFYDEPPLDLELQPAVFGRTR